MAAALTMQSVRTIFMCADSVRQAQDGRTQPVHSGTANSLCPHVRLSTRESVGMPVPSLPKSVKDTVGTTKGHVAGPQRARVLAR